MSSRNEIKAAINEAVQTVGKSFDHLCLLADVEALTTMMDDDVNELAGEAYERNSGKPGYRWGRIKGGIGFHGDKIEVEHPRVRSKDMGAEMPLPSWQEKAYRQLHILENALERHRNRNADASLDHQAKVA